MFNIETIKRQVLFELQNDEKFRQDFIYILLEDNKIQQHIKNKLK